MKKLLFVCITALALPALIHAQFIFRDVTVPSQIDAQASSTGVIAGGLAVFDFDNDGYEDIYMAGGQFRDHIYHNNHDGTFTDVAPQMLAGRGAITGSNAYSHGATAFDYDNDGLTDLYVITEGNDMMWKNHGDSNWTNESANVGIRRESEQNQSNCATFGDFDGDGDNDLYVGRWVREAIFCLDTLHNQIHYCHKSWPNLLYVNNDNGTFTELGKEFSVDDTGTTNIAILFDYDRDGDLDILTGNDFGFDIGVNQAYKNMLMETGKATFTNVTKETGLGQGLFCMGIGPNDYNRDGNFDFAETNIGWMPFLKHVVENGKDTFVYVQDKIGYPDGWFRYYEGTSTRMRGVTWTTLFNDWDNDGWEDAFITHGFLNAVAPWYTDEHDTSIFLHNDGGTFHDVTDSMAENFYIEASGRGAANIDFDNDGRMDIVFGSVARNPGIATLDFKLLHNETQRDAQRRQWLEIECHARRTAKEAIGTTIDVWTQGIRHSRQVCTGGGFGAKTSLLQHFGLGAAPNSIADSIVVYWPADKKLHRQIDHYFNVPINQKISYSEDTTGYSKERSDLFVNLRLAGVTSDRIDADKATAFSWTTIGSVTGTRTIEMSTDNKATWQPILTITNESDLTANWTTPNTDIPAAYFRISTPSNIQYVTPTPVRIAKEITKFVIVDAVANKINANSPTKFTWSTSGSYTSLKIEMSKDNANWETILTPDAKSLEATWTTPDENIPEAYFRISNGTDVTSFMLKPVWIYKAQGAVRNLGGAPSAFNMTSNYPNPVATTTSISFDVPTRSFVTLIVRNELGQEVATLANETIDAGTYQATLDAKNLSTGLYTYTLTSGATKLVGKMQVSK